MTPEAHLCRSVPNSPLLSFSVMAIAASVLLTLLHSVAVSAARHAPVLYIEGVVAGIFAPTAAGGIDNKIVYRKMSNSEWLQDYLLWKYNVWNFCTSRVCGFHHRVTYFYDDSGLPYPRDNISFQTSDSNFGRVTHWRAPVWGNCYPIRDAITGETKELTGYFSNMMECAAAAMLSDWNATAIEFEYIQNTCKWKKEAVAAKGLTSRTYNYCIFERTSWPHELLHGPWTRSHQNLGPSDNLNECVLMMKDQRPDALVAYRYDEHFCLVQSDGPLYNLVNEYRLIVSDSAIPLQPAYPILLLEGKHNEILVAVNDMFGGKRVYQAVDEVGNLKNNFYLWWRNMWNIGPFVNCPNNKRFGYANVGVDPSQDFPPDGIKITEAWGAWGTITTAKSPSMTKCRSVNDSSTGDYSKSVSGEYDSLADCVAAAINDAWGPQCFQWQRGEKSCTMRKANVQFTGRDVGGDYLSCIVGVNPLPPSVVAVSDHSRDSRVTRLTSSLKDCEFAVFNEKPDARAALRKDNEDCYAMYGYPSYRPVNQTYDYQSKAAFTVENLPGYPMLMTEGSKNELAVPTTQTYSEKQVWQAVNSSGGLQDDFFVFWAFGMWVMGPSVGCTRDELFGYAATGSSENQKYPPPQLQITEVGGAWGTIIQVRPPQHTACLSVNAQTTGDESFYLTNTEGDGKWYSLQECVSAGMDFGWGAEAFEWDRTKLRECILRKGNVALRVVEGDGRYLSCILQVNPIPTVAAATPSPLDAYLASNMSIEDCVSRAAASYSPYVVATVKDNGDCYAMFGIPSLAIVDPNAEPDSISAFTFFTTGRI